MSIRLSYHFQYTRTRPTSKNSDDYLECHTGSHSENRDKATPPKLVRKSSRQNMMRNLNHIRRSRRLLMKRNENDYIEHVKSCSGVENKTFSANLTTSKSTNVIPATSSHNRTRLNSSHCIENCAGSHLENEVTATPSKNTPSKPTRRSFRQLRRSFRQLMMVRNDNDDISNTSQCTRKK